MQAVIETLTLNELSKILRIHPFTVTRLAREGKLPAFKVGNPWGHDTYWESLGTRYVLSLAERLEDFLDEESSPRFLQSSIMLNRSPR